MKILISLDATLLMVGLRSMVWKCVITEAIKTVGVDKMVGLGNKLLQMSFGGRIKDDWSFYGVNGVQSATRSVL